MTEAEIAPVESVEKKDDKPKYQGFRRNRIPDRWLEYAPTGKVMDEVRIVAFKTPLRDLFYEESDEKENIRFDIKTFVENMKSIDADVGLVIDLTYTTRYYSGEEWTEHSIEYLKILCPGHNVDQYEREVDVFKRAVMEFFGRNEGNRKLVGVHCTHGLNRTGYMICRYMIDELRYSAQEAIEMFESCRGHPMERYKKSLEEAEKRRTVTNGDAVDDGNENQWNENEGSVMGGRPDDAREDKGPLFDDKTLDEDKAPLLDNKKMLED